MLLLALALALSAPVPKELGKPPELAHGSWVIHWGGHPYLATLSGDGDFAEFCGSGPLWQGRWEWDADTRILTVRESTNGDWFILWRVKLDAKMSGTTDTGTKVRIEPFRVPMEMEREKGK